MGDKNKPLTEQVVLITGAGQRIGAELVRHLHAHGARIVLHYRSSRKQARALQSELNEVRAESVVLVQADLLNVAKLPAVVQEAAGTWERLDVLINNASSFFATPLGKVDEKQWDDLVGTNLKAPFFLSQAAAPHLARQHGCIVNIADIHAERPLKDFAVYSAAKAGLAMLTRALASELGPRVRVNAVAPGAILWPDREMDQVTKQRIISRTLLKRQGEPREIAQAVRFLIADAPYITGQILTVDGGRTVNH